MCYFIYKVLKSVGASATNKFKKTSFISFFEMLNCHQLGTWGSEKGSKHH